MQLQGLVLIGAVRMFEDIADGDVASGSMVAQPEARTYGTPLANMAAKG